MHPTHLRQEIAAVFGEIVAARQLVRVGRTIELLDSDPSALFRQIVGFEVLSTDGDGSVNVRFTLNAAFPVDPTSSTFRGFVITRESDNFFVDEEEQVDSMQVNNGDSVAGDQMTLSATRITGLGMGPDRTIGAPGRG